MTYLQLSKGKNLEPILPFYSHVYSVIQEEREIFQKVIVWIITKKLNFQLSENYVEF